MGSKIKTLLVLIAMVCGFFSMSVIISIRQNAAFREGQLAIEYVKDTSLPILREEFNTYYLGDGEHAVVNCNYKKINSVPGDIVLRNKLAGSYIDEYKNEVLEGFFLRNLHYVKNRHSDIIKNKIYFDENTDGYFKEKMGFYLAQKFDNFMKTIKELAGFVVKDIYIERLRQPDMRTSRTFYVNFDVLIHREEKNHGKHLKCLGEIVNIKSLSKLNFNLILYSVKVVGVVMEDKLAFDPMASPFDEMRAYQKINSVRVY